MCKGIAILTLLCRTALAAQQTANPRQQRGATITMFAPEQHDLYDGHYSRRFRIVETLPNSGVPRN